ncbi:integral membrane sensor signal transduction histidine kinase [Alkalidesulfovibrio alkalitolerans DSM 16529]|uniref:histidine kinase n=1 Tax=Alkalidesulfovibrio alkalitolerans DSM 16529 TaxID=1121439 RepID=S7TDM8_9BACT|nr:sensor histidine kinase [Alkalidesulfovibrio alkalitolerans]EPR34751.1 integral membrane sensor signal transduction histidine kinase [Alkalidesulfovibrio alkalitolerans DSM 16529]
MPLSHHITPSFWNRDDMKSHFKSLFNYRKLWRFAVLLTLGVSLLPLLAVAVIDYTITETAAEQETVLRTSRLVSNTRRIIDAFFDERLHALMFIAADNTMPDLAYESRLWDVLLHLQGSFGGFVDIGVIDANGLQLNYVGPYNLLGRDYSKQDWFQKTLQKGTYISEVSTGFRGVPHISISVRKDLPGGEFFILRATIDTDRFNQIVKGLYLASRGDAFIINRDRVLQTPSRNHGDVLTTIDLPLPPWSASSEVIEIKGESGRLLSIGYAYIHRTPFVLVIVKDRDELLSSWHSSRRSLLGFLFISIGIMVLVLVGVATMLVNRIHLADLRRVQALRQAEHASKMASIGRLAAGVAHEINNPLAIIGEKAGLMKDIFVFEGKYAQDKRLMGLADSILAAVERGGAITKRLLGFARHIDMSVKSVDVLEIIKECLEFLHKEAEFRSIEINVQSDENVPVFESDHGKLQQIFINIFNNAFAAMSEGGHLNVHITPGEGEVVVHISDDGCGIPKEDLGHIFEPFFSTKKGEGGTGLGLSITYGLVQELGGRIEVESTVGKGTTFHVHLPTTRPPKKE